MRLQRYPELRKTGRNFKANYLKNKRRGILVDAQHMHLLTTSWPLDSAGYPHSDWGRLHTVIMGSNPRGMVIDHINQNKLDNRQSNLRFVSQSVNGRNHKGFGGQSRYRGVHKQHNTNCRRPWVAQIRIRGKVIHLGSFFTEEEAARTYDEASEKYCGDDGWVNFNQEEKGSERESSLGEQSFFWLSSSVLRYLYRAALPITK